MTIDNATTTVQITIPKTAPAELLERVQAMARDLAENAGITVELAEIRSCQKCGCTDDQGCMFGCSWVSETEDLCTSCAPAPSVSLLVRQLVGYSRLADNVLTAADPKEDFHINLQECIENRSGFYIPVDELISALDGLTQLEPASSDEDALVLLQEQLERTASFYIPVDELEAAIRDLQARGWSVIISYAAE
mgnify:CR=1 FL=1